MNANIRITYRDKEGNEIFNPSEGQMSYSPETQKLYKFTDGSWKIIEGNAGLNLNLYDLNKQIMSQLPDMTEEQIDNGREIIKKYLQEQENEFYMLLCRDISYYTLFQTSNLITEPAAADEVIECAKEIGALKSIDANEANAIEIWVHPVEQDPMVMYLFSYDSGVIQCAL